MLSSFDINQTSTSGQEAPATPRFLQLRWWMMSRKVSWADFGRCMRNRHFAPVSASGAQQALAGHRMGVANHTRIREAYPDLPVEYLPIPLDVPTGPKPKNKTIN